MQQVKNSLFILGFLAFVFAGSHADAQQKTAAKTGITFSTQQYKQVLAGAKASHKKVFVDAYATWCQPCKALRSTSFKDAKAAAYYNRNFISMSLDVEKGEGAALAKTWEVQGLPTLLILDENGSIIARHVGYLDGNGLLDFAKEAAGK